MRLGRTQEEKQQREVEREAKERSRQLEAERKYTAEIAEAFRQSPAGQAKQAFERGDAIFQFEMDVRQSSTYTIPMFKTGAITNASSSSDVLNSDRSAGMGTRQRFICLSPDGGRIT